MAENIKEEIIMANTIRIKRGLKADLAKMTLLAGELGIALDTQELYVGDENGNAIGIVGGLVIGQAAVEANLVSPIVVMIVALTALGSMTVPNEEFAAAFRLVKYVFLILGGYLGIYELFHHPYKA